MSYFWQQFAYQVIGLGALFALPIALLIIRWSRK
jgi:hypothetical protein